MWSQLLVLVKLLSMVEAILIKQAQDYKTRPFKIKGS